jgi:hypothetical protein
MRASGGPYKPPSSGPDSMPESAACSSTRSRRSTSGVGPRRSTRPSSVRGRRLSLTPPTRLTEQVELAKAITKAFDHGMPVFEGWGLSSTIRERRYGCLPGDTQTEVWVGIKEENNGTTYIASPVEIPSLDDLAFNKTSTPD